MTLITSNFSMSIRSKSGNIILIMQFFNDVISTKQFPKTSSFLKQYAPRVLQTTCFNPGNLSFRKEVKNTELGHLFEHILLSCLCEESIKLGSQSALFYAVTEWNWKRYPKGNFKIIVTGKIDKKIFEAALSQSVRILELLFSNHKLETIDMQQRQQPLLRPLSKPLLFAS